MKLERYVNFSVLAIMGAVAVAGMYFRTSNPQLVVKIHCANPVLNEYRLNCDGVGEAREFVKLHLGQRMDINKAREDDLRLLPGISAKVAQNIVEMRAQIGRFNSIEELLDVKRIGEKTLEKFRDFVEVSKLISS